MESRCDYRYGELSYLCATLLQLQHTDVHMVRSSPADVCFVVCAGTRLVRNVIRPLPNSTTGGHRWALHMNNNWSQVTFMGYCSIHSLIALFLCPGYHLCLRHHKPVVLSAPSEVGQWCGWSKPIRTLISFLSLHLLPFTVAQNLYYLPVRCWCLLHTQWLSVSDKMMKSPISVLSVFLLLLLFCSMPQAWCRGSW